MHAHGARGRVLQLHVLPAQQRRPLHLCAPIKATVLDVRIPCHRAQQARAGLERRLRVVQRSPGVQEGITGAPRLSPGARDNSAAERLPIWRRGVVKVGVRCVAVAHMRWELATKAAAQSMRQLMQRHCMCLVAGMPKRHSDCRASEQKMFYDDMV